MTPLLLLTGFEPFGGDDFNPSGHLARGLHGHRFGHGKALIEGLTLPVSGPAAWRKLARSIRRIQPRWIIATGVSGRAEISLESTAWNEDDFRIPDNAGLQPRATRILVSGASRLESGIQLAPEISPSGLPIRPSTDPGRFVCNHLYYRLLHLTRNPLHSAHRRACFFHFPGTPEMRRGAADRRFIHPMEDLRRTVLALLEAVVTAQPDPDRSSGATFSA